MTSPITVVVFPSTGLPMIEEVTVVVLQGWSAAPFFPTSPAGSLYEPFVGLDQSGNRIPGPLAAASPAISTRGTATVAVLRRIIRIGCRAMLSSFMLSGSINFWQYYPSIGRC